MRRRLSSLSMSVAVAALVASAAAGCGNDGTIDFTWTFEGGQAASALSCAERGVFSIWVTGHSTDGQGDTTEAACAAGMLKQSVPASTWSFTLLGLDRNGCYRGARQTADTVCRPTDGLGALSATSDPIAIAKDQTSRFAATFVPLPSCDDGVDNNGDGRVDLDDPLCQRDPNGTEASLPPGAP